MKKKQRILELEKQVKFLLDNANYKKIGVYTRRSWCVSGKNQFVKYFYNGKIKETEGLGECLFIVKDSKDSCIIKSYYWGVYSYMLLDKNTNSVTKLPRDYKPLLETVEGKSLIVNGKKMLCEWERVKTSEQPLLYELKVRLGENKIQSFISSICCNIKFDDIGIVEFFMDSNETKSLLEMVRLGNSLENVTITFTSIIKE